MLISKKEDKIYISFINNKDKSDLIDKYHIFIKNIAPDGRSKIDHNYQDTKIRLNEFFREVEEVIKNEYHQMTVEEYLIKNNNHVKELKYVFKRNIK